MNRTEKIVLSSLLAAGSAAVVFGIVLRLRQQSGENIPFPYRIPEGGDVDELSETPESLFV